VVTYLVPYGASACGQLGGRGFDELLPHSEVMADGTLRIRVIDLPTLIEIKTADGRPKDKLVLPLLLARLGDLQEYSAKCGSA